MKKPTSQNCLFFLQEGIESDRNNVVHKLLENYSC